MTVRTRWDAYVAVRDYTRGRSTGLAAGQAVAAYGVAEGIGDIEAWLRVLKEARKHGDRAVEEAAQAGRLAAIEAEQHRFESQLHPGVRKALGAAGDAASFPRVPRWDVDVRASGAYLSFDARRADAPTVVRRLERAGLAVHRWGPALQAPTPIDHAWFAIITAPKGSGNLVHRIHSALTRRGQSNAHPQTSVAAPPPSIDTEVSKRLLTPEGNFREGPFVVPIKCRNGAITFRLEVVDEQRPLWLCLRITDAARWSLLCKDAEGLSPDWSLPLLPASQNDAFPAPLIWRCGDVPHLTQRMKHLCAVSGFGTFEHLDVRPPAASSADAAQREDAEVARLKARRSAMAKGRRYPINGSCDQCGQPLSDPFSLLVGVGPVCREYYSPRVLHRVATEGDGDRIVAPVARQAEDAVARLQEAWR